MNNVKKNKNAHEPITIVAIEPPPILFEFDVSISKLLAIASARLNVLFFIY